MTAAPARPGATLFTPAELAAARGPGGWARLRAGFRWRIPPGLNIPEACCEVWARAEPDRVALVDLAGPARRDWTYGALSRASTRLAHALAAAGVRRGDRVAVLLPQGAAVMLTQFAAQKLGAVALPLFTLFGQDALAFRLGDSGARAVVTDGDTLERVLALAPGLPDLAAVFATEGARAPAIDLWDAIARGSEAPPGPQPGADDPAVMIYTSGTTGNPKGVLHAHRYLVGHLPAMELSYDGFPQPGDRGWTPADWAWIGGLMDMAIPCLYYGVPLIAQRMRKFDPEAAVHLIRTEGVRNAFLPPTALRLMRGAGIGRVALRSVASGGESLGGELLDWGRETLGAPIAELYGQTECNLMVTQAPGFMPVRPGSMGQPLPGFDVAVIDAAGAAVPAGTMGEIAVRRGAGTLFLGYWNQPDKTAARFTGDWMRTGDLGVADDAGYLTYVARDDDVITSAGYRIGPSEIEDCLTGDPDVVMAGVVGVPDPVRTEAVVAYVVLRPGAVWDSAAEARLVARVRARISPHVAPRRVIPLDALPTTATGKIVRRDLRARPVAG
jgi:acetyl-CoA synthetase